MTIEECAGWLLSRDNFLILTHRRPDGDTLGSAAALAQGLRCAGKTAYLLKNPETTERYLPFVEKHHAPAGFAPDFVVSVDTASVEMLDKSAGDFAENIALAIDHHPSNTGYAKNTVLDPKRAACGEIVCDILEKIGPLDAEAATSLYVAVATDTGCFSYENTNAGAFSTAAKLAAAGADAASLNRYLFRSKTRGRIAVEGMVFSNMEFLFDGRAAIVVFTGEMMQKAGATEDDMENIAAFPVMAQGVEVGATIREMPDGLCKVSLRSGATVNSNELCARFGGGGHASAAGFMIDEPPQKTRELLIPVLGEFLGHDGDN
ncbi:MAG: phosphoesterase RecJ domain-containing protein [Clostridiales bacterium]|nr:phosphoesterase RecJ domain-containing protein [Clostridiales bacterium]